MKMIESKNTFDMKKDQLKLLEIKYREIIIVKIIIIHSKEKINSRIETAEERISEYKGNNENALQRKKVKNMLKS